VSRRGGRTVIPTRKTCKQWESSECNGVWTFTALAGQGGFACSLSTLSPWSWVRCFDYIIISKLETIYVKNRFSPIVAWYFVVQIGYFGSNLIQPSPTTMEFFYMPGFRAEQYKYTQSPDLKLRCFARRSYARLFVWRDFLLASLTDLHAFFRLDLRFSIRWS